MTPKEIVIVSGKGGTGKTCIMAALCSSFSGKAVFCDVDVDAPNLQLLLHPQDEQAFSFTGRKIPEIDTERCTVCGGCVGFCRFNALEKADGSHHCHGNVKGVGLRPGMSPSGDIHAFI